MIEPEHKTTIWVGILVLAVLGIFAAGWYKYIYSENYFVYGQVSCDEKTENCFTTVADSATTTFKIIEIKANQIPACDQWSGNCAELSCKGLSPTNCQVFTCSDANIKKFGVDAQCSQ